MPTMDAMATVHEQDAMPPATGTNMHFRLPANQNNGRFILHQSAAAR